MRGAPAAPSGVRAWRAGFTACAMGKLCRGQVEEWYTLICVLKDPSTWLRGV